MRSDPKTQPFTFTLHQKSILNKEFKIERVQNSKSSKSKEFKIQRVQNSKSSKFKEFKNVKEFKEFKNHKLVFTQLLPVCKNTHHV